MPYTHPTLPNHANLTTKSRLPISFSSSATSEGATPVAKLVRRAADLAAEIADCPGESVGQVQTPSSAASMLALSLLAPGASHSQAVADGSQESAAFAAVSFSSCTGT